ncbi:flagellar biosynthetic protein FlhB [Rhodovulum bhavnagarense]|uniref:Flagellar biosynthetic protein FlhB n=1 Tax=Rhodovulum bhavnagarense TaxID=992286 RepID=A0A4R2RF07_9RHOB|nr:flagellar type III secretion system protein FlhB [Rhodovulum bhavnagarense]TCP61184.1 flagellar biosynthetic protein FlhB [Rhodovulum bhavnagarense]
MSASEDGPAGEKPHDPTPKKLEDARKKGEVPRSTDLDTAAAYAGMWLAALAFGTTSLGALGGLGAGLLGGADRLAPLFLSDATQPPIGGLLWAVGAGALPWLAVPGLAIMASILTQRSLVFAPSRLKPKLSRISPVSNAAQKFGRSGLFEFAKSAVKLLIYGILLGVYLAANLEQVLTLIRLDPGPASAASLRLGVGFMGVVVAIAGVFGVIDLLWQQAEHRRRHRMSHEDLKEEIKQAEGDPQMKQQRRQRAFEIATNRMLADVPGADVVIVNPRHYAVALSWDRTAVGPPVCVAKGMDEIAARIREVAAESGVPMRRDPPTARAIYATVDIGQPIRRDHYRAVAAAIRFAEAMRQRARRR